MKTIQFAAFCGSLRQASFNHKLLTIAAEYAVSHPGVTVKEIGIAQLPLYDGDSEAQGMPEEVRQLKADIEDADALLIASPEYNYSVPGVLKNAIDWASRGGKNSFGGKAACIMGASTGPYGTVRGQTHLRQVLAAVNVLVLPQPQVLVKFAKEAFNPDGSLKDEKTQDFLKQLIEKTITLTRKLKEN